MHDDVRLKFMKGFTNSSVASFCAITKGGDMKKPSYGKPCHADVKYSDYKGCPYIVSALYKEKGYGVGIQDEYIKWLINDSYCSDVFVDKDLDSVKEKGFLIDASKNANVIGNALIASRMSNESSLTAKVKIWKMLHDRGVNGDVAFIIGHMFADLDNKEGVTIQRSASSHEPFDVTDMSLAGMKNVCNRIVKSPENFMSTGKYTAVFDAFKPVDGKSVASIVREFLKKNVPFTSKKNRFSGMSEHFPLNPTMNALAFFIDQYCNEHLTFIDEPMEDW